MTPENQSLVRDSFAKIEPITPQAAAIFYDRLFVLDSSLKPLFKSDMNEQGRMLMAMIGTVVANLSNLETIIPAVQDLGRRHATYGVQCRHYETVGAALLWTLEQGLGEAFTQPVKAAWTEAYTVLSSVMQTGAAGTIEAIEYLRLRRPRYPRPALGCPSVNLEPIHARRGFTTMREGYSGIPGTTVFDGEQSRRGFGPPALLPSNLSVTRAVWGGSDRMGSISTRMTERFGCRHPFAGAGLAFAGSTADLALGVCAGGGIGAIGVGFTPAEQLRTIIRQIRAATEAPFNINFITCFDNDAQIRVCAEEKVPVASFHWGHLAVEHLTLLRDAGVSVWEQIGNVEAARKAVGEGVEVIVAQGWEAGGHNYGGLPTMGLVPGILDGVSPALVLASGGIVDGRGVAAALALGADGVWVGTRLVATPEAAVHSEHKRRLVEGKGEQTVLSSIFGPEWPAFNPIRVLRNRVVDEWTDRFAEVPTVRDDLPVIGRTIFLGQETEMRKFNVLLPTADTDGDWEEMPWLAGQGVGLIHDIRPAKDVVETMMTDAKAILQRLSGSL